MQLQGIVMASGAVTGPFVAALISIFGEEGLQLYLLSVAPLNPGGRLSNRVDVDQAVVPTQLVVSLRFAI